jgi:PTH1 family peptidyl-tRNA hydrolase
MWLIVGLGNPGRAYAKTRHNLGFMVIDILASKHSIRLKSKLRNFVYSKGCIQGKDIILIKPLTYMNRSGSAVVSALRKFKDVDKLLVVYDDLDLNPGVIRIKKNGSAGGHKGIQSVLEAIGSKDFLRLKVGIGKSDKVQAEDYVLSGFTKLEKPVIKKTVEKAVNAIEVIISKGVSCAQNEFHKE